MKAFDEFIQEISEDNNELLLLLRETVGMVTYYRKLLTIMELDTLTGLSGSNKYHNYLGTFKNNAAGVGVLFFDVNDLKYYNDNKGHKAGDILLQKAAESLVHLIDWDVRAFRIGGDEFAVITTNRDESDLEALLEKWRFYLAELNQRDDGITCSVSVGFALGSDGDTMDDIIKLADERMYENKKKIKAERGETPR